jgi:hypothetical protein
MIVKLLKKRIILPLILIIILIWAGMWGYGYFSCNVRWISTGYKSRYSYVAGCLIQQSTGKWLPEDKMRPE